MAFDGWHAGSIQDHSHTTFPRTISLSGYYNLSMVLTVSMLDGFIYHNKGCELEGLYVHPIDPIARVQHSRVH